MMQGDRKYWAILIGINFYRDEQDHPRGCVWDVQQIEQYLLASSVPVNVRTFTASVDAQQGLGQRDPIETKDVWPTFENITEQLDNLARVANQGDFVYIHYSGHGTRTPPLSRDFSNHDVGDLALVLFNKVTGQRYFRGVELASKLGSLVDKGILVTLVLDCCASGSVVRRGGLYSNRIRAIDYNPVIDEAWPSTVTKGNSLFANTPVYRNATLEKTWRLNPQGYTIFAACGPHEIATELILSDGQRSGALTYLLLQALTRLRKCAVEVTNQSLHEHLRVQFHVHVPTQTPMRYGSELLAFFGPVQPQIDLQAVPVFWKNSELHIQAGQAHGVCVNDGYSLHSYPHVEEKRQNKLDTRIEAKVTTVNGLSSALMLLDSSRAFNIETGWIAKPLTHIRTKRFYIRLTPDAPNRKDWIAAFERRHFLSLANEVDGQHPVSSSLNVIISEKGHYEILDQSLQRIKTLPTISVEHRDAIKIMADILDHVARFKVLEGIANQTPNPVFIHSFNIEALIPQTGVKIESGILEVKENQDVRFSIQNLGDKPIYIHVLSLGALWEITNVYGRAGGGQYRTVPPKNIETRDSGETSFTVRMTFSSRLKDRDLRQCEDTFIFFVTNRAFPFTMFELDEIPATIDEFEASRGSKESLSAFLGSLGMYSDRGTHEESTEEQWMERHFIIRTVL